MLPYTVVICTLDRFDDLKRCFDSWLLQQPRPAEIVIVHGGRDDQLEAAVRSWPGDTGVPVNYVRMAPSLVRQRNAGIDHSTGDVVFFVDDDAEYVPGYAKAILQVYEDDTEGVVGGVQGTIEGFDGTIASRWGLSKVFMLPRMGDGTLQPSAWPAFYRAFYSVRAGVAEVQVFSGPAMSFRRKVLQEFRFDEELARYWVGDDFEMAYRISQKYRLLQVAEARLYHYVSPVGRDSARRQARMAVVNHFYLSRKCFGSTWRARFFWLWSELGMCIVAFLWMMAGRGPSRLLGMIEGYRELWTFGSQSRILNS